MDEGNFDEYLEGKILLIGLTLSRMEKLVEEKLPIFPEPLSS